MNYQNEIETRPLPPIEIPRCEMILPMPRAWLEAVNRYSINVESQLAGVVCDNNTLSLPAREMQPNPRFKARWDYFYRKPRVPSKPDATFCRAGGSIRTDILRALEVCALQINRSAHFLALKIVAGSIEIQQESERARTPSFL